MTQEENQAFMKEYGIEFPQGGPSNLTEEQRATLQARFQAQRAARGSAGTQGGTGRTGGNQGGEILHGSPPDGGGFQGGQPNAQGTPQAGRANRRFGGGFNTIFVDPLISGIRAARRGVNLLFLVTNLTVSQSGWP